MGYSFPEMQEENTRQSEKADNSTSNDSINKNLKELIQKIDLIIDIFKEVGLYNEDKK